MIPPRIRHSRLTDKEVYRALALGFSTGLLAFALLFGIHWLVS